MQVHAAHIQDRDGAPEVLASIRYLFPWLRHVFADGAYAGQKLETALLGHGQWTLEKTKAGHPTESHHVMARVSHFQELERTFIPGAAARLSGSDGFGEAPARR